MPEQEPQVQIDDEDLALRMMAAVETWHATIGVTSACGGWQSPGEPWFEFENGEWKVADCAFFD